MPNQLRLRHPRCCHTPPSELEKIRLSIHRYSPVGTGFLKEITVFLGKCLWKPNSWRRRHGPLPPNKLLSFDSASGKLGIIEPPISVGLWRSWERASMALKRSRVRLPPGPPFLTFCSIEDQVKRLSVCGGRSASGPVAVPANPFVDGIGARRRILMMR